VTPPPDKPVPAPESAEHVDDADLESALDEAALEPGIPSAEVMGRVDAMIAAIGKAVG